MGQQTTVHIEARVDEAGTAAVSGPPAALGYESGLVTLAGTSIDDACQRVITYVSSLAMSMGQPVQLQTIGPSGRTDVVIRPDGEIVSDGAENVAPRRLMDETGETTELENLFEHEELRPEADSEPTVQVARQPPPPAEESVVKPLGPGARKRTLPEPDPAPKPITPGEASSFLTADRQIDPAAHGFRGWLTRLGWKQEPTAAELAEREDVRRVSRHWTGPRTIAVANPKGGTGKTPCTAFLSSVFAHHGGSGVVAWDANQLRGTLGWQTETGSHENHVVHLLDSAERLLQPNASMADLAALVHHQTEKYEVLRSVPDRLPHDQQLSSEDFDSVHRVLAKYYRLIIVDSGNDESAATWTRMIDKADQLVVPTTTSPKSTEAARLMLTQLAARDEHSAELARNAVVLVSQTEKDDPTAAEIAQQFTSFVREAVVIPKDAAIRARWLRHSALHKTTQRAYLRATAAVADSIDDRS